MPKTHDIDSLIGTADDITAANRAVLLEADRLKEATAAFEQSELLGEGIAVDPDVLDLLGGERITADEMEELETA